MPMRLNAPKTIKITLFGVLPFAVVIFFVATGFHYIPVNATIGVCMMDYTSPSTYQERPSPLMSLPFEMEGHKVLVCYGSPSARDRKVFGNLVPYDRLWRFGANEPTRLYTTADLVVGEVVVPKGRYSLYTIPGKDKWEVFISKSTLHWGNMITKSVRGQEIGSFEVRTEQNLTFAESFMIDFSDDELVITWEKTKVRIPIVNLEES